MWDVDFALFGGGLRPIALSVTTDQLAESYNVYTQAGSPADPVSVVVTITSAQVASILIPTGWHSDSLVELVFLSGANAVGSGGFGGMGGAAEFETGFGFEEPGAVGGPAGSAIVSHISFRMNLDNGFALGGGGGGGGGGGDDSGSAGRGGGGGGGGRGWNNASKGSGGFGSHFQGMDGVDGSITAAGAGGSATSPAGAGGAGGNFGAAGTNGQSGGAAGGTGGAAGFAISFAVAGRTLTLTGAKNEATLTSESRLVGGLSLNGGSVVGP
jgi:hypothetical protein